MQGEIVFQQLVSMEVRILSGPGVLLGGIEDKAFRSRSGEMMLSISEGLSSISCEAGGGGLSSGRRALARVSKVSPGEDVNEPSGFFRDPRGSEGLLLRSLLSLAAAGMELILLM